MNTKFGDNASQCYTGKGSLIVHVKSEEIYEDFAEDTEMEFDT